LCVATRRTMKTLFKIYSASCLVFVGFLLFFSIPFDALPFPGSITAMVCGGVILAAAIAYILIVRSKDAFEFGWFLANKGGFWVITVACLGLVLLLSGLLILVAPNAVEPAFERGAWPVAGGLVILFWFALIFMFAFLTFVEIANAAAFLRVRKLKKSIGNLAVGIVCLAMATLFFSLFLEVINEVFFRISIPTQWIAIWVFVAALIAAGAVHGGLLNASEYLETEDENV